MMTLAKQKTSQRFVFKIHSTRLRQNGWELTLTPHEARRNEELIALSDSTVLRFIDELRGVKDVDRQVRKIKSQIRRLKVMSTEISARHEIRKLYDKLDELQFKKDYVCLIIDKRKDYRYVCKHGFVINGIKYRRLLGTTGGVKNSTIVFVSEFVYDEIWKRIENGRDENLPLVPAKLEAYKALTCSASTPVTLPKGILVVKDVFTTFKADIIHLDDTGVDEPVMQFVKDYDVRLNVCDGCGMILPELAQKWADDLGVDYLPAGFCTRYAWEKGMVFTFDFIEFAEKVAKSYIVTDIWGNEHDIRDIDIVLTESMLKLWDAYSSLDDYLENCMKNNYSFSITKVTPKELEKERNLNYQFIQSFRLTDEEIDELIQPTIDEIKDVLGGDYRKSILFLKGAHLNDDNISQVENDYVKALMIDKNMINDPFVRSKIHFMIKKRINDAKTGVVKVHGNFSIISGDLYALCQSMFGLEVTGLLKAGELYSEYWKNINAEKVAVFRAPMTCHNNIKLLKVSHDSEASYWFRYMSTITILNSWDTTCDALNGADKDGDMVLLTDNQVLVNNVRDLPTIMCVQRNAVKKIVTETDLIKANIDSFGDEIGTTTNRITSMYEVQSQFDIDSEEYKTLDYRIACGQLYQQNAIDKTKGIIAKPMPKTWYDRRSNVYSDEDDLTPEEQAKRDFNLRILADKKPYFMCYIYPQLMNDYKKYVSNGNKSCLLNFGITFDELLQKPNKTDEEQAFLNYYYDYFPVGINPCIINKIAWRIEKEFDNYINDFMSESDFDHSILKSETEYTQTMYLKIGKLYDAYKQKMAYLSTRARKERMSTEQIINIRNQMKQYFIKECFMECPNVDVLCNIVLDLCYKTNNSKQFTWDVCGDYIIHNMLRKNKNTIYYPTRDDENPEFFYGGEGYRMAKYKYNKKEVDMQWF